MDSVTFGDNSSWSNCIFSGRNSATPLFSPHPPTLPLPLSPTSRLYASAEHDRRPRRRPRTSLLKTQTRVRLEYNAKVIGARDALFYYERYLGQTIHLAPPSSHSNPAAGPSDTTRACLLFLLAAVFTIPVLVFAWAPIDQEKIIYAHLSLAFASVIQIIAMWEFFPGTLVICSIYSRL